MYGFAIPTQGWALLAKLLAGDQLTISKVMVGSGTLPSSASPAALAGLIHPEAEATSTAPSVDGNVCSFVIEYRNDLNGGLATGFWLSEFGVYAIDPDVGEILLYYGSMGEYPQYVSAHDGGSVDIRRFPVSIALSDDLNVVIGYPAMAFMTAEDVESYFLGTALPMALVGAQGLVDAHNVDPGAHQDIRTELSGVTDSVAQLLESVASMLSRIEVLEFQISNTGGTMAEFAAPELTIINSQGSLSGGRIVV